MSRVKSEQIGKRVRALAWILILILMTASATHLLRTALRVNEAIAISIAAVIFAFCVFFGMGKLKSGLDASKRKRIYVPLSAIPMFLLAIWAANARLFGSFDVSAVLFHLKHGLEYDGVGHDIAEFAGYLFFALICILCLSFLARRDRRMVLIERLSAAALLLVNPVTSFGYDRILNPDRNQLNLAEIYQPAVFQPADNTPKNLLLIYLESLEATFSERAFGDVFEDLNALSQEGLRIEGIAQIQDTSWTTAGMVASQCGVPLLSYGLVMKNRMKNIETFLPNADCLASRLSDRGYQTRYYGGAPLTFAGKGKFLETHGYETSVGLDEIPLDERGPMGKWGIYDDRLFELAAEELQTLTGSGKPYLLSVLTSGPHGPAGHFSPRCHQLIESAEQMDTMLLSVACTAKLTRDFLETAKSQGLLENTVVVLMSDHLAQITTVTPQLEQYERENFMLLMGAEINPATLSKTASLMDVYPTILEAIGHPTESGKAGLGVSLLGQAPTLLEQHGIETLNLAIRSDKDLREQIWGLGPPANP